MIRILVRSNMEVEVEPISEGPMDLKFRHVIWPTTFAIILVAICAHFFLEYAPPMSLALILAVVVSPLLGLLTKSGKWNEHLCGVAIVCIPMSGFWLLGESYCNIAIPFMFWVWMSSSWSKYDLPPFRYGIWHGFGIAFSIIPGALLYDALF